MNETFEAALAYSRRGFSVIPVKPWDKKPFISWKEFENRRATDGEIRQWWQKWPSAMVAIVTGEISGLFVVDCDTAEGFEEIQKLLPDSLLTPLARTPRGGWHLFFQFPEGLRGHSGTKAALLPGVDIRGNGGYVIAAPSVNGKGRRYAWGEGLSIEEAPPGQLPDALYKKISFSLYRGVTSNAGKDPGELFQEGRRDEDLFHVAHTMLKGGAKEETAFQVLKILARNCNPPFPENEILAKIESALKRSERRDRNFQAEVEDWVSVTDGYISVTDCYGALQVLQPADKTAIRVAFHRLCKAGILEKHGNRDGVYRRRDTSIDFLDFENADPGKAVDLSLPLDLHLKTKLFPKAAVVIAGVSGMGKTLFALNTIRENLGRFPIFYFNSEMGPEALKKKLQYFPTPVSEWARQMRVVDNWDFHNIPDKIQPDALNVIDYLEPEGDKPYNIHGMISAIIRRLNKGTALICIQKKPEAKMGTGGVYSIKAATLALALDWGRLEIVKNRFREEDPFPSLTKINFEVHKGWKIVPLGGWYK